MAIQKQYISNSSNVSIIEYDDVEQILYITFKNGTRYKYLNVDINLYTQLLNAPSKGVFISRIIKGSKTGIKL